MYTIFKIIIHYNCNLSSLEHQLLNDYVSWKYMEVDTEDKSTKARKYVYYIHTFILSEIKLYLIIQGLF